ncbi:helix-turn-helix domain-containing protein [uncultured Selenomonas sp.]|uniref:helix-turn-helix domain-containing protein n=1 Tax=uncultured Selenomonas sp. TaxID=159275 RepID=UPI0028D53E34|nr:helix-turn-helix domain-containing protein [uncultured Selenomonas sp.]
MPRKAADAATLDIVKVLTDAVERIAAEKVAEQSEAATQRIIEYLPEVVYLPPKPAEDPLERLLSVGEVADLLGCSPRTVQTRMDNGELVYVLLDPSSNQRKVPYSWVVEYMHNLPRYVGKVREKKVVAT